jgi:coenzyme PQQ precursor peptide PqqA
LPRSSRNPSEESAFSRNIPGEKKLGTAIARGHSLDYHLDACAWQDSKDNEEEAMAWTTPTLVEICIGLEINGYLPAEF